MYQFVKAVLRPKRPNSDYETITNSDTTLKSFIDDHIDGYFEFSNSVITGPTFITLLELRQFPGGLNTALPISQWLASLGNTTIEGSEYRPIYNSNSAIYCTAWDLKAKINKVSRTSPLEGETPDSEKEDLSILLTEGPIQALQNRTMISINGLWHRTEAITGGIQVFGGGRSNLINRNNNIGLLSFTRVADVSYAAILPDMVQSQSIGVALKDGAFIDLQTDLTGKSIMLVLGGVLHAFDGSYKVINPEQGVVKVDFNRLDPIRQISRTYTRVDLTPLGIVQADASLNEIVQGVASDKPGAMNAQTILSDLVLKNYLTMESSFFVVIDAPNVITERLPLEQTTIPGLYVYPSEPLYPLIDTFGICHEYSWFEDGEVFSLTVSPVEYSSRVYETIAYREESFLNNINQIDSYRIMPMDMLQIKSSYIDYQLEATDE